MLDKDTRLQDFPTLGTMTYLNTAAEGIPPPAVGEALADYVRRQAERNGRARTLHFAQWDSARKLAGQLYGLSSDEVGICSCSSEAYNLAAMVLRLCEGDEIVVNDLDFPAGATPWLLETSPATVRIWRARDGALRVEDLKGLLGPRHPVGHHVAGQLLQRLLAPAARGHRGGPRTLAGPPGPGRDSGAGPDPLRLEGVDLIVSSTHKWILASHGGCLVGVPDARKDDWNVPAGGWFNLHDPFGPDRFDRAISRPGAAGFMVGMPNFPAVYAIAAALEYIIRIGVEAIDREARPLVAACVEGLSRLPVELLTPRAAGLMGRDRRVPPREIRRDRPPAPGAGHPPDVARASAPCRDPRL